MAPITWKFQRQRHEQCVNSVFNSMNGLQRIFSIASILFSLIVQAQDKKDLPAITPTFKGSLNLPAPLKNPLFQGYTETIGQLDAVIQVPVYKGLGLGAGAKMTWYALKERALAPFLNSGEVRRASFYGKVSYEEYTSARTFFELSGRVGISNFVFDCMTCVAEKQQALHWGAGAAYYVHVSHNLAFGFILGY